MDEAILPTFSIVSCADAIIRAGTTPVVIDSDPHTLTMVPEEVEKAITPKESGHIGCSHLWDTCGCGPYSCHCQRV